jgi:hypothetical protein
MNEKAARPARPADYAFTLIEVQVAIALLLVGLLGLASATSSGMSLMSVNRDHARASEAARIALESVENGAVPFESLFLAFHADPVTRKLGDLELPDGLPLLTRHFDARGLRPVPGDPDGMIGELIFPTVDTADGPELREDVAQRDLNGDGVIDEDNHAEDYTLLPVTVRVEWAGKHGPQRLEFVALLTRR